jgi:hypothetical protein
MSRATGRLAWALTGTSVVLGLSGLLLTVRLRGLPLADGAPVTDGEVVFAAGLVLLSVVFPAVGALIASRHPRNPIGWMLIAFGLMQVLTGGLTYGRWGLLVASTTPPLVAEAMWLGNWIWAPSLTLLGVFLPLLLPTGSLPSRRWRPVVWVAGLATAVSVGAVAVALWPKRGLPLLEPTIELGWAEAVFAAGVGVVALCALAAVASLVMRFRHADGGERQQLKWVGFGAGVAVAGIVAAFVDPLWSGLSLALVFSAMLALPAAIGVAVLRYRLYEIDRIISRTVSYGLVTGVLAALYVGGVFLLTPLVAGVGGGSELAVAAATLAVAAAFGPVRRRVQAAVDRRFNRARYDARRTVEEFAYRLRDEVDLDLLAASVREVARSTIQPTRVSIWFPEERS